MLMPRADLANPDSLLGLIGCDCGGFQPLSSSNGSAGANSCSQEMTTIQGIHGMLLYQSTRASRNKVAQSIARTP